MMQDPRLIEAILRKDLYCFIQAAFPIVSPGALFAPNWHLEAMAYHLTRVLDGEIKRLIVTIPPRGLKSICGSICFPAFVLGHDPTRKIICVSYAESLARKHANDCRAIMRSALYKRVFPNTRTPDTGAAVSQRIDNAMVKAIAWAFRWGEMLENSTHATIAETAAAEKINCGSSSSCSAALVLCVL